MTTIYLDLNIFDRLEKLETLKPEEQALYQPLHDILTNGQAVTAYSNAHLNDLFRGYQKNPTYTQGHLTNIEKYTNNLCICQYWGEKSVKWHYRNVFDFFRDKEDELLIQPDTFDELFNDIPELKGLMNLYKLIPLDPTFKKIYSADPLMGIMFPRSKEINTFYSLMSDIHSFHIRLKSDYGLYKVFKGQLMAAVNKIKDKRDLVKALSGTTKDLPKHLELMDIFDAYVPDKKVKNSGLLDKVIDTFFKYDLVGYKTDGHYNNMFDDALHTFYAAHFDYFITNDERCKYKALKTYERLKLKTTVIGADHIGTLFTT